MGLSEETPQDPHHWSLNPILAHKLEGNCAVRPRILASTMCPLDMAFLVKPGGLRMAYLKFPSLLCSMDKVSQLKDPSYPEQQVLFLSIPEDWASVPRTHTIIQESQLHLSMGARDYPYPLDATKPAPQPLLVHSGPECNFQVVLCVCNVLIPQAM